MRAVGFHASKGVIRIVVIDGSRAAPVYFRHERRPLVLIADRPQFLETARNLFSAVITTYKPDRLSYVLTMSAKSQVQLAGLIMPFGALNACARESGKQCIEFISPNFSRSFFKNDPITYSTWKAAADDIIGTHPPNWTDGERQAALAALGAL